MEPDLPAHPVLAAVARHLVRFRWMASLMDHEMRLVWLSPEFEAVLGSQTRRFYGKHFLYYAFSDEIIHLSSHKSVLRSGLDFLPMFIEHTPGGRKAVRSLLAELLSPEAADIVDHAPDHQDPVWMTSFMWTPGEGMSSVVSSGLNIEIHDRAGAFVGVATIFLAPLPPRLVALLARGDEAALERMARLTKPGRRSAAVLFADVQSSGVLSRRLPSSVYFRLIRTVTTAIDQVVIEEGGIVGRHAGDGATAFFLTEDLGSPSSAARAAIEAARRVRVAVQDAASAVEAETDGLVTAKDCTINMGIHWGGSLYMGQLNTGGRLEVTALGDAVNECARVQETARDGEVLVSKALIENLDAEAASALGLDPDGLSYVSISQVAHASEKAIRDAGGIAVTSL
jgi:class 3 adenylate cyclase